MKKRQVKKTLKQGPGRLPGDDMGVKPSKRQVAKARILSIANPTLGIANPTEKQRKKASSQYRRYEKAATIQSKTGGLSGRKPKTTSRAPADGSQSVVPPGP